MYSETSTQTSTSKLSGFVRLVPIKPQMSDDVVRAVSEGFKKPITEALTEDVRKHLEDCHFGFSFIDGRNTFAGFAVFKTIDSFLYLSGCILRPAYQGSGLVNVAVFMAQSMTGAPDFALRTQSSLMWSAGQRMTRGWTPHLGTKETASTEKVERLIKKLGMASTIVPGFYNGPLYGEKPEHQNSELQNWWDSICNFERGDAVLCSGRF